MGGAFGTKLDVPEVLCTRLLAVHWLARSNTLNNDPDSTAGGQPATNDGRSRTMKKYSLQRTGFTLVELMVVVSMAQLQLHHRSARGAIAYSADGHFDIRSPPRVLAGVQLI